MLPSSPHVKEVYCGDGQVLKRAADNALALDCSTIDPGAAREVASAAREAGVRALCRRQVPGVHPWAHS